MKRVIGTALLSVSMLLVGTMPALAQAQGNSGGLNTTAAYTPLKHSSGKGTQINYIPSGTSGAFPGTQGWAGVTNTNGASCPFGPKLIGSTTPGPGGSSGAATAAPFQGTYNAPGSFALQNQGQSSLPPTQLTSFVKDSGYDDSIFGDEGTDGPPPLSDFSYLEGAVNGGLTTGHQSDAPSAWGYPQ